MKVLHLFSMAGVAEMLCGPDDRVFQLDQFDEFGFAEYYKKTTRFKDLKELIREAERVEGQYDKIVIHDFIEFRHEFTKSKLVFIFHGTKLRGMTDMEVNSAKQYPCFVTGIDLMDILPQATFLPAPVDLDLFKPVYGEVDKLKDWFCINRSYQREFVEKSIKDKYPKTEYYERNSGSIIHYEDMPDFLGQHSNYVDMKYTYDKPDPKLINNPSCTGIQALAVGCTVHTGNGTVMDRKELLIHDRNRVRKRFLEDIEN